MGYTRDPSVDWLGDDCCLVREGDVQVVVVAGSPLLRFEAGNKVERRFAAAVVAEAGLAPIGEVQRTFGLDDATLWRARKLLREGGVSALLPAKRGPKGPWKVGEALIRRMVALREEGCSAKRIGERLGLSAKTVRDYLAREGFAVEEPTRPLPFGAQADGAGSKTASDEAAVSPPVAAVDPAGNTSEGVAVRVEERESPAAAAPAQVGAATAAPAEVRAESVPPRAPTPEVAAVRALLGATQDGEADVVFESALGVPFAGLLLTVPALTGTGLLEATRTVYGRLRRGVYGLRATVFVLAFLALLRRPRPEALKGTDPAALGDVLGLLRAPEVKTVRRKLKEIDAAGKAHELVAELGRRWLRERADGWGLLYVDGHVRVYDGKRKLPKAHVTQKNLCLPATTDYWVNAADGQPLFVVTANANAAMTKVLPRLLDEAERLADGRKGMVVFDRGGWSPVLFKEIVDRKWDILTYRKGKKRKHSREQFRTRTATIDGRNVSYTLSERNVRLKNGLRLREIAELRDDGGQTLVLTSDFEPPAVELAYRMFERWRQENYFRYMKENFALDALVDYAVEPDDPARDVPNPARKTLDKKIASARAELAALEQAYGAAAADNVESKRSTMRGFKIANGEKGKALRAARVRVAELRVQRRALPKRVPVGAVLGKDQVVKLAPERKLFTDAIKSAVYRAETTLLRLLSPHFKPAEREGRAFLREAVKLHGDLVVDGDQVVVRLAPMSAPRFTAALRALCEAINATAPRFPETRYHLRYEVGVEAGP